MISFNVQLRVAGASTATGTGTGSGAGSGPGSGTGSRSGTGTGSGSGSGCPSGKLIKYSSTVWSRTSSVPRTETSRAKNATWRSSSPADQMPQQSSSVANLFPVRPGVTLLFVFLSSEGFHAKALRALVADGDF